jgi:hypothetical protein
MDIMEEKNAEEEMMTIHDEKKGGDGEETERGAAFMYAIAVSSQ